MCTEKKKKEVKENFPLIQNNWTEQRPPLPGLGCVTIRSSAVGPKPEK